MELNCHKPKINSEALLHLGSPLPLIGLRDATKDIKQMSKSTDKEERKLYLRVIKKIRQDVCWYVHIILKLGRPRQEDLESGFFELYREKR